MKIWERPRSRKWSPVLPSADTNDPAPSLQQTVIRLAIESWRFSKVFERMVTKLDAGEQARYRSQSRWFMKNIEDSLKETSLRIVNVEGSRFDPGMAATPLNAEEFGPDDALMVDQMIEPIIMGPEGLLRGGTVTLRKMEL